MKKNISLKEMVQAECGASCICDTRTTPLIFDTNALKYRYALNEDSDYKVVLTCGVLYEVKKNKSLFKPDVLRQIYSMLNPQIITPFVSEEDEYLIGKSASNTPKRLEKGGDIGWVDTAQIGYAMERSRNNLSTILISNDGDILSTVKNLRRILEYMKDKVSCVSVQRYLERKYFSQLDGLERPFKRALFTEIDSQYKIAS